MKKILEPSLWNECIRTSTMLRDWPLSPSCDWTSIHQASPIFEGFAERDKGVDYHWELATPKFSEVDRITIFFIPQLQYIDGPDLRADPEIR